MKNVTISLSVLYEKFGGALNNGTIDKTVDGDNEYYDLYVNDQLVCMDGETCEILEESNNFVLVNYNSEQATMFELTTDEMKIATAACSI